MIAYIHIYMLSVYIYVYQSICQYTSIKLSMPHITATVASKI